MNEEMIHLLFKRLYPDLIVKSIEFLPRQTLNENSEWIEDTKSVFIGVGYHEDANFDSIREDGNISTLLSNLTGFEFNVFIQ